MVGVVGVVLIVDVTLAVGVVNGVPTDVFTVGGGVAVEKERSWL